MEAETAAIRDANNQGLEATSAKGAEGYVSFVTDDAAWFPPNAALLEGKEAVREFVAQVAAMPGLSVSWQLSDVEVSRGGDIAYSVGTYELTSNDAKGNPTTERGKYVDIWRKQPDGSWKCVVGIWNSNEPAASE